MDVNVASPLLEALVLFGASLLDVLQLGGVEGRVKRQNRHAGEQELGEGQVHSSALALAHAAIARQQAAGGRTGRRQRALPRYRTGNSSLQAPVYLATCSLTWKEMLLRPGSASGSLSCRCP